MTDPQSTIPGDPQCLHGKGAETVVQHFSDSFCGISLPQHQRMKETPACHGPADVRDKVFLPTKLACGRTAQADVVGSWLMQQATSA